MIGRSVLLGLSLSLAALVCTGCSGPSYDHSVVTNVSQSDLSTTVTLTTISLPLGAATRASIKHFKDDDKQMGSDVASDAPTIVEVAPGLVDGDFVFMGRAVGTTTVRFLADGQVVAIAKAEVTPQGAP